MHSQPFSLPVRGRLRAPASLSPAARAPAASRPFRPGKFDSLGGRKLLELQDRKGPQELSALVTSLQTPGRRFCPSAWPRPARPSASQVSRGFAVGVPGPSSARPRGAAARAHFAPGSLEVEKVNGVPSYGPRSLDEMFSISKPPLFSSVSEDNDRTNRRLTDKGRRAGKAFATKRNATDVNCHSPFSRPCLCESSK